MREYKFRGRSIEPLVGDDQWLYGFGVHVVDLSDGNKEYWLYTESGTYEVDPETVGQTISYFGKNFSQGDLVSIPCYCDSEYGCGHGEGIYEIAWNDETVGFALRFKGTGRFESLDNYDSEDMHLIGNRWDNPELLEEKVNE